MIIENYIIKAFEKSVIKIVKKKNLTWIKKGLYEKTFLFSQERSKHADTTRNKKDDWCLLPIITGSNHLDSLHVCVCDSYWKMPIFQISEFSSQSRSVCWQKWQFHHHHHECTHSHFNTEPEEFKQAKVLKQTSPDRRGFLDTFF